MKTPRYFVIDNGTTKALVLRQKLTERLHEWTFDHQNPDYVFVLGGDGTSIQSAIRFRNHDVKLVVIKAGNFGFLAGFDENSLDTLVKEVALATNFRRVNLLKVQWNKQTKFAFNDVVLSSPLANRVDVYVSGTHLETCWNSGFIFATPLGSTGINKSSSGPIISPLVDCWVYGQLNPISHATFSSLNNALILPKQATLVLKNENSLLNYSVIVDGISQPSNFIDGSLTIECIASHVKFFFSWKLATYVKKMKELFVRN